MCRNTIRNLFLNRNPVLNSTPAAELSTLADHAALPWAWRSPWMGSNHLTRSGLGANFPWLALFFSPAYDRECRLLCRSPARFKNSSGEVSNGVVEETPQHFGNTPLFPSQRNPHLFRKCYQFQPAWH